MSKAVLLSTLALLLFVTPLANPEAGMPYHAADLDLVIVHGRVMDPASGLDAIRNIGLSRGRIAAISAQPLRGKETIDARRGTDRFLRWLTKFALGKLITTDSSNLRFAWKSNNV